MNAAFLMILAYHMKIANTCHPVSELGQVDNMSQMYIPVIVYSTYFGTRKPPF